MDLDRIIELRARRRDKKRKIEHDAVAAANASREALLDARRAMDDYAEEVKDLEIKLLTKLVNTRMKKSDFKAFEEELEKAEQHAKELVGAYKGAKDALKSAEEAAQDARRNTRFVETKLQRITQMGDHLALEAAEEQVKINDAKSDEIAEMMFACRAGS